MTYLIYFRPSRPGYTQLDAKVFDVASHYRGRVQLVVKHSDESGHVFGAWISGRSPTVLLVRNGCTVAQMVGDLPLFEIEGLVRAACSTHAV